MLAFGRRNVEQNTVAVAADASNSVITQGTASRGQHRTDSNCSHQDKKYNLEIILSHCVDHVLGDFQPK